MAAPAMSSHICPEIYSPHNHLSSTSPIYGGDDKSAFTVYKPVTVLTNLQRGNVPTQAPVTLILRCIHHLVAQGDIPKEPFAECRVELCDSEGLTPLMWASFHGQLLSVRKLIGQKANINARGFGGQTALLFAACRGHSCIVTELIAGGANVNFSDCDGCTALMYAASGDHGDICRELLSAGANLTTLNEFMDNAYDLALASASQHVLEIFENHLVSLFNN